jgi:hypothetical protein
MGGTGGVVMKQIFLSLSMALVLAGCSGAGTESTVAAPAPTPAPTTTVPAPTTTVPAPTTTEAPAPIPVAESAAPPPATTPPAPVAPTRSITVGGIGSEFTRPVRCVVDLGLSSRGPSVIEASQAAAAAADAIIGVLTSSGVAPDDIQTSDLSIDPVYDRYPTVTGYEMDISYRVTMRDLEELSSVLAQSIVAGGDDVRAHSIRFEADTEGLIEVARVTAWSDAEARAEAIANLAGDPLGDVLDVHEKVLITSRHGMVQGGEGDSASFDIPVSPGMSGVTVLLTVTYAIGE